jgi:hypothetical protein
MHVNIHSLCVNETYNFSIHLQKHHAHLSYLKNKFLLILKIWFLIRRETHCICIIYKSVFNITVVYFENHTKHMTIVCVQNAEIFNTDIGCLYSNHCTFKS